MKKFLFFVICSIFLFTGCDKTLKSGSITCSQKNQLLSHNKAKLIDVRSEDEYLEGHLDNAINIPYDVILEGIQENNISVTDFIVVYCKSGGRSSKAFETLKNAGYRHIYDLGSISSCSEE